ncbi:hypothetical protein ACSYAY_00530 [Leptospirillum ferriphilum]|jgi:hypothetical protein|uniref:hypothetical protein n=1 Tax=Leptospirillum ferriphilum TaxID=178606 RepID=UPI003EE53953
MEKKEPKESLTSTSSTRPHPSVIEYGYNSPPDPSINGYSGFLRWMYEDSWNLIQAILLYLSFDPEKIPTGKLEECKSLVTRPGLQKKFTEFTDLYRIALKHKNRGKIEDSMSPDRWINWFISLGNGMNEEFFKAYKATFPETSWEARSKHNGFVGNFERRIPSQCSSCTEKHAEIEKLKNEIGSLKKMESSKTQGKMASIIAALVKLYYGDEKVNTSELIADLERKGCPTDHETLNKYLKKGSVLLKE